MKPSPVSSAEKLILLSRGEWQEILKPDGTQLYSSQSEADIGLCSIIARTSNGERAKVDAAFRKSGLFRPKWDEMRGSQTYGELTIAAALKNFKPGKVQEYESDGSDWRECLKSPAQMSREPLRFIVENFLPEEGITLLCGLSGHGKSLTALSLAKSLCLGQPAFGIPEFRIPQAFPVVYLGPEMGEKSLYKRLTAFGMGSWGDEKFVSTTYSLPADQFLSRTMSDGLLLKLSDPRVIEMCKSRIVFLDTFVRFLDGHDENDATEMQYMAECMFNLLQQGCLAVVPVTHSPKSFENCNTMSLESMIRGSGDIGATLSAAFGLRMIDEPKTHIHVECLKMRDAERPKPFHLFGRPQIHDTADFTGTYGVGTLSSYLGSRGRPPKDPTERLKAVKMLIEDPKKSTHGIGALFGVSHECVRKWKKDICAEAKRRGVDPLEYIERTLLPPF
ncbi:MAG TPA: AAA family ATPase [Terriglobales bacterium]|nr:AAA family ATPase [Terriglobales bacterium]